MNDSDEPTVLKVRPLYRRLNATDLATYARIAEMAADLQHGASVFAKTQKTGRGKSLHRRLEYASEVIAFAEAHEATRQELIRLLSSLLPLSH